MSYEPTLTPGNPSYILEWAAQNFRRIARAFVQVEARTSALENLVLISGKSTDPDDPEEGTGVIWISDGTGSGADGDMMIKITDSGGTTKTGTLVDFSTL